MKVSIAQLQAALEKAAETLRAASGRDKFISQSDIASKLGELDGAERAAVAALHKFLQANEPHPNGRTTWSDLDRAMPFIQHRILAQFRLLPGRLSEETKFAIASLGKDSVDLAIALKEYAWTMAAPKPEELAQTLAELARDLEPVGYHHGQYKPFEPVYLPGPVHLLTPETFLQTARQQHPLVEQYTVERLVSAHTEFFLGFVERQKTDQQAKAQELIGCMEEALDQISVIILEKEKEVWHPTYLVGLLGEDVVGIKTDAMWQPED